MYGDTKNRGCQISYDTGLLVGASLSEPHIDGTTGRNHICIIVRPSPARRAWSHEVCRASNITLAYMASVVAREADVKEEKDGACCTAFTER